MEETVIDDIISLESSLNDEFMTLIDSGVQLANTVKTHSSLLALLLTVLTAADCANSC